MIRFFGQACLALFLIVWKERVNRIPEVNAVFKGCKPVGFRLIKCLAVVQNAKLVLLLRAGHVNSFCQLVREAVLRRHFCSYLAVIACSGASTN